MAAPTSFADTTSLSPTPGLSPTQGCWNVSPVYGDPPRRSLDNSPASSVDDLLDSCGPTTGRGVLLDPSLPLGDPDAVLPIEEACRYMITNLPEHLRPLVKDNLKCLRDLQACTYPKGLPVGSACSGSDLVTPALDMFFSVLGGGYQDSVCQASGLLEEAPCRVGVDVKWACEVDPRKQRWLHECMLIDKVFKDIRDISCNVASTTTSADGEPVDDIYLYSCGFCCQSVSKANPNSKDFAQLVLAKQG